MKCGKKYSIFYVLIASFIINCFPVQATRNYTGDVWDYDATTHTATYSCPIDTDEQDLTWTVYSYPAVLGVATTVLGILSEKILTATWHKVGGFSGIWGGIKSSPSYVKGKFLGCFHWVERKYNSVRNTGDQENQIPTSLEIHK